MCQVCSLLTCRIDFAKGGSDPVHSCRSILWVRWVCLRLQECHRFFHAFLWTTARWNLYDVYNVIFKQENVVYPTLPAAYHLVSGGLWENLSRLAVSIQGPSLDAHYCTRHHEHRASAIYSFVRSYRSAYNIARRKDELLEYRIGCFTSLGDKKKNVIARFEKIWSPDN